MVDAQFVHCKVEEQTSQKKWLFTIVCAYNELNSTQQLWEKLMGIGSNITGDLLISGDFNNVLQSEDRIGAPITMAEVQGFKEFLDKMQLTPLKSTCWYYTWCNKMDENVRVYSKIDWDFGNFSWMMNNGHVEAEFLNPSVSDHSPILMNCQTAEEVWVQNDRDIGKERTWHKLRRLKEALRDLNNYMAPYQRKLKQAKWKLELVQHQLSLSLLKQEYIEQENEALLEVEKWSDIEEKVLRQKFRAIWIQHGDPNTKYFHA
ncbi:PREDICTED: uncharacterized protein LOC109238089 [Nicotiana attenuata]|uniref:uncharacterized protein LOC109238089 n=1 Tax=Nicotiana attenuata TaxID=49451 RepID=UPI000904CFE9|nr:PREDICTED: uncharacterized protein LOC109238089 [Nicotiana attenuata]